MNKLLNKIFFIFAVFLTSINLCFSTGWDLWVQLILNYVTIIIFILTLCIVRKIPRIVFSIPFLFLIILIFLSTLKPIDFLSSSIFIFSFFNYLMVFILSSIFLSEELYKKYFLNSLLILGGLAAFFDLIAFSKLNFNIFLNQNIKAGFFLVIIPLFYYKFDDLKNIKSNKSILIFLMLFLLSIFSFFKANSLLGNIMLLTSFTIYFSITKNKKLLKYFLPLIFIFLIYFSLNSPSDNFITRIEWMKGGIRMILQKPVLGWSPGSISHILPNFININKYTLYLHSFFIQIGAEMGILVLILIFWLFIYLLINIYSKNDNISLAVFTSTLTIIIYNFFEYNISIPLIAYIFWMLLGSFSNLDKKTILSSNPKKQKITIILFICGLLFYSFNITRPFIYSRYFSKGIYNISVSNYGLAETQFMKSLKLHNRFFLPYLGLAQIEIIENNYDSAIVNIEKSFPLKSNNPIYQRFTEGISLYRNGDITAARNIFIKTIGSRFLQYGLNPDDYIKIKK